MKIQLIKQIKQSITGIFRDISGWEVVKFERSIRICDGPYCPDMLVVVQGGMECEALTLVVGAESNGQPRVARRVVAALLWYIQGLNIANTYGVFMAPYISTKTAEICRRAGVGYIDFSGNCRLCFGNVYIERKGQPNKYADKRGLRSLYSPKATRILRVLLHRPRKRWTVSGLAREAKVSLGLVSKVKKLLVDREWLGIKEKKIFLLYPDCLLKEWSTNYSFRQNEVRDYYSLVSKAEFEARLASVCLEKGVQYALTAFSGASRLAPAVSYQKSFVYVATPLGDISQELGLKQVPGGANVTLMRPYDVGVFYQSREIEGVIVATPIQIYLDLVRMRGRGEEAAQAIYESVVRVMWDDIKGETT